jgi:hypothetical protein
MIGRRAEPHLASRIAVLALATAVLSLAAVQSGAQPAPAEAKKKAPLRLGLTDPVFSSSDPAERAVWLDRAAEAGADSIRLLANWRAIADAQPPADPSNPADPGYGFGNLDAAVRDAAARGFRIVLTINRAPDYAEGPNRPATGAEPGTWKPSPSRLAEFATALASRYSGSFADPATGAALPRVALFEIWGEPNLFTHLTPQTEGGRVVGPTHYRDMVNAASRAIKGVNGSNEVIAGGTAPFGDHPPVGRTPPLTFWMKFFCLKGKKNLKPEKKCPGGKPRVDAFAHNPLAGLAANETLPTLGPADKAPSPTDILVPDMHKLYDVLKAAREHRMVKPRSGTELWVTELLWETNPPDSGVKGVSLENQAAYLAQSLQSLQKQGVSEVRWVRIRDDAPSPDFASTIQSGLYFHDGTPKPALQAFQAG